VDDARERYNRSEPAPGTELLTEPSTVAKIASTGSLTGTAENASLATMGDHVAAAVADDFSGLRNELEIILAIDDPMQMRRSLIAWQAKLPERAKGILANPRAATRYDELLSASLVSGLHKSPT
jgi:hypothetical protein